MMGKRNTLHQKKAPETTICYSAPQMDWRTLVSTKIHFSLQRRRNTCKILKCKKIPTFFLNHFFEATLSHFGASIFEFSDFLDDLGAFRTYFVWVFCEKNRQKID